MICFKLGGGGTGKSYLIQTTSQWVDKILREANDNPLKPKILLLAYTGNAASLIGGTTFHSGLAFKFGSGLLPLTNEKKAKYTTYLEDVEVVIIDEMSMASSDILYNLHKRLTELFFSEDLFGGKSVLLVGDIMQLPPVKAPAIYQRPKDDKNAKMFDSEETNLWLNCQSVELETNFRQGEGNPWTEMLNRIRIGEHTEEDIEILKGRPSSLLTEDEYKKATHLYYTNAEVNQFNTNRLNELPGNLYEVQAICSTPKGYTAKTDQYGNVDKTQFVMTLQLKIGARVMVVSNISIMDSLVNGSLGTIIDVGFIEETGKKLLIIIVFSFDVKIFYLDIFLQEKSKL